MVLRAVRHAAVRGVLRAHRHREAVSAVFERFFASQDKRTCERCGTVMERPSLPTRIRLGGRELRSTSALPWTWRSGWICRPAAAALRRPGGQRPALCCPGLHRCGGARRQLQLRGRDLHSPLQRHAHRVCRPPDARAAGRLPRGPGRPGPALLLSIEPAGRWRGAGEDSDPAPARTDLLLTRRALEQAWPAAAPFTPRALVVRTLPNPRRQAAPRLHRTDPALPVARRGAVAGRARHRAPGGRPALHRPRAR